MARTVFITGATGYIGGTVFDELLRHPEKFEVTAFVRSNASASIIEKQGAKAIVGNYDQDLQKLTDAAKEFDVCWLVGASLMNPHVPIADHCSRWGVRRPL
jgi:uncharacterized protein YbjT (DUF2867 family)